MDKQELINKIIESVIGGDESEAEALAKLALDQSFDPLEIINEGYVTGIKQVGDMFESGELFLPELIQSAGAVKKSTALLNDAIKGDTKKDKGKVVIATVEGDMHDIGKAIVSSLMVANGFEVLDLGRDVPIMDIITRAEEFGAQVIGTSALLTTTMVKQQELEKTLRKEGLRDKYKTIVGGAPVTVRWAEKIGADAFAENAGEGVNKIIDLIGG
ncbi:MAG: cobalamin-dependent protein [Bacillota bacterium]